MLIGLMYVTQIIPVVKYILDIKSHLDILIMAGYNLNNTNLACIANHK